MSPLQIKVLAELVARSRQVVAGYRMADGVLEKQLFDLQVSLQKYDAVFDQSLVERFGGVEDNHFDLD